MSVARAVLRLAAELDTTNIGSGRAEYLEIVSPTFKGLCPKKIFISADHGMAIIYFLQSDVVPTLLAAGVEVVVLTDDDTDDKIAARFARPGLTFEGLRLKQANDYARKSDHAGSGCSPTCGASAARGASTPKPWTATSGKSGPRTAGNSVWEFGFLPRWRFWSCARAASPAKPWCDAQTASPPNLYTDLFEKYQPDLVIASTPGWRMDRYLLREAAAQRHPDHDRHRRLGQLIQLRRPRRADGVGHLLVAAAKR